jgi:Fic family protein
MDISRWQEWFLGCLLTAIENSSETLNAVMVKARFWDRFAKEPLNQRQIKMMNKLLDGFEGKLTSSKWAKIAKCSQDTAIRDIKDLIDRGALKQDEGGGRSTSYSLVAD